jgi:ubiquinone/menaquinone biosynthesis C-methylase UbiE
MAVRHPIFARFYAWMSQGAEHRFGIAEHRDELLAGLSGRLVEIGAGNGLNFGHYPDTVEEVTAVEPEPYLRKLALAAASESPVRVRVTEGAAERLEFGDASFDAGVCSLVLCSVGNPARALAELFRVIKPGGELRFYEHVLAQEPRRARWQRRVDVIWPFFAGGCHTARRTTVQIERAGFEIAEMRRFEVGPSNLLNPVAPHVLGRARRP